MRLLLYDKEHSYQSSYFPISRVHLIIHYIKYAHFVLQHPSIDESEFCEEPVRKEKLPDDEETFIESPRFTDKGLPTILLTHPPPNSREALPPIRTFQLGQKDVNVVPPLQKKLPPVPDDIRMPQSLRPAESDVSERRPDIQRDQEPVPSTSGVRTSAEFHQAASGSDVAPTVADGGDSTERHKVRSEPEIQPESTTGHPEPSELPSGTSEQMREASSIAAPATMIMTSETQESKGKSKATSSKPFAQPTEQKGKTPLRQERSTLTRSAKPKTPATKKPVSKTVANRSFRSETAGKKRQTPRLKSDLTSVSLAKGTPSTVESKAEKAHTKQESTDTQGNIISAEENFLKPSNVIDALESKTGEADNVPGLGQNLSLENDLTIVSTANEDFSSTTNTDIVQDEILSGGKAPRPQNQTEGALGFDIETDIPKPDPQDMLTDTASGATGIEPARLIHVGRGSLSPERLPSRESTASISSTLDPVMPSVEAVDTQAHTVLHNGVSKLCENQHDRFQDTDYSSGSFSSDSEVEFPDTRTDKKPQQFFLEAEISHIPLEHPRSPFLPDTEARTRFSSAATQRRAMSSRLLSSSYGTRSNVQVQAYNPLAEAKETKKVEIKVKKAKVAAEKADAKTKGLKRLKAMKNTYGSLKKPQRR